MEKIFTLLFFEMFAIVQDNIGLLELIIHLIVGIGHFDSASFDISQLLCLLLIDFFVLLKENNLALMKLFRKERKKERRKRILLLADRLVFVREWRSLSASCHRSLRCSNTFIRMRKSKRLEKKKL